MKRHRYIPPRLPRHDAFVDAAKRAFEDRRAGKVCAWCANEFSSERPAVGEMADGRRVCAECLRRIPK